MNLNIKVPSIRQVFLDESNQIVEK
jgi:hypothetical protein